MLTMTIWSILYNYLYFPSNFIKYSTSKKKNFDVQSRITYCVWFRYTNNKVQQLIWNCSYILDINKWEYKKRKKKNWTRQIIKYYENDMKIGKVRKQHNGGVWLECVFIKYVVYWKGCFYRFYELERKKINI